MKKPRFKYYLSGFYEGMKPEPMYSLWLEDIKGYSDVSGQTLATKGLPIPPTPTFNTWKNLIQKKKKCSMCFSTVKNATDLSHHNQTNHWGASAYVPS